MIRRGIALSSSATCALLFVCVAVVMADPPIVVSPNGPQGGNVEITVGTPGYGGSLDGGGVQGSGSGGSTSGCTNTDATNGGCNPCTAANSQSAACQAWQQRLSCSLQNPAGADPAVFAQFVRAIGCATNTAPRGPTASELAQRAYGQLTLPSPLPARYPAATLRDGRPYTVVRIHMWFWTDASTWNSVSKRVCAGALCATATARPSSLSFSPGDGGPAVSCHGPGTAWTRPVGGSWVPGRQRQGCDYSYRHSSFGAPGGEVTATYMITWTVTWTGTNGTAGALGPMNTAADARFAVAEAQTVVIK